MGKKGNIRDCRLNYWTQSVKKELERKNETTFSLSNGYLGLRGTLEELPAFANPEFYIANTYAHGPAELLGYHDPDHILTHPDRITKEFLEKSRGDAISTLPNLPFPAWIRLTVGGAEFSYENSRILSNERLLDMENAVVGRIMVFRDGSSRKCRIDSERFTSCGNRNLVCMRYSVTPLNHSDDIHIAGDIYKETYNTNKIRLWDETSDSVSGNARIITLKTRGTDVKIAISQRTKLYKSGNKTVLDLFCAAGDFQKEKAVSAVNEAYDAGYDKCLARHMKAWNIKFKDTWVDFDENPAVVQGFNFGQMHLNMAVDSVWTQIGVPIKGLTGHGYRFAVFWDMDFHMFPYYLYTKPDFARLILQYRYAQIDKYRENAARWNAKGVQVPWETQNDGCEVTAPWLCLQEREIHISADASYMFKLYDDITGDHDAMVRMGAEFIMETGRFYISRIRWSDKNRRYELPDIGCPDQYHTFADNNFFISVMAAWNIRYAIELAQDPQYKGAVRKIGLDDAEIAEWRKIIKNFFIQKPGRNGIIEEFDGYFNLSEDTGGISELYCSHSQAVKQPDVLAGFAYFEDEYNLEIRKRNFRFYVDKTINGSSLSLPGIAFCGARCGLNDESLYYLDRSCRMDLDDVNLDTERGVHMSGYAVQWFAVVNGFGGLTLRKDAVCLSYNLPRQWSKLDYSFYWKGQHVFIQIDSNGISVLSDKGNKIKIPVVYKRKKYMLTSGKKIKLRQ